MHMPKRAFTLSINGLILAQLNQRRSVTGRSLSGEVCYLLQKALEQMPEDSDLKVWDLGEEFAQRTSLNINRVTLEAIGMRATEMRLSTGRLLNILLKYVLEKLTQEDQGVINDMARRDQALHSL